MASQRRQFWVILVIVFLGFLGSSMPYLIFPVLFLNPLYSILPASYGESSQALLLGITLAAYPLGQFIGSPILGSLSDDYGRKRLLSWSLFIAAICNLLTGIAIECQGLALLIASRFMAGLMEGNVAIARAMVADITTIPKQESFGKMNAVASIAYILGPLLGGVMADKNLMEGFTASMPFYFICFLCFCLTGISMFMLKNAPISAKIKQKTFWQYINIVKTMSALFSNKRLQFLMVTSTLFTLAVDIFYEFGPVYLTVKWDLGPAELIIYNGLLCVGLFIGNGWPSYFFSGRRGQRLAVLYSLGGLAILLLWMVFVDSVFLMISLFTVSGVVIGLAVTLLTVKISNSVSDKIQGEVLGAQLSLRVLGDAIICLLGGVLLLLSSKIILIVASAISVTSMVYYAFKKNYYIKNENKS